MKKVKVDGHTNLIKDCETGAILSVNSNEYENYIHLKNSKERESKKMDYMYSEISNLKKEVSEIKEILRGILDGSN